jgi:hypothetical protein
MLLIFDFRLSMAAAAAAAEESVPTIGGEADAHISVVGEQADDVEIVHQRGTAVV